MTKETFQAVLKKSYALSPLFSGELDAKITALKTLAQHAEDSFWTLARAEFDVTGGQITARPHTVANSICTNALTLVNQILVGIHGVCAEGTTHSDLSWTASKKTLYAPFVAKVCDALLEKTATIKALLEDTNDMETYTARIAGFADVYEWALGAFGEFGPNFPEVLTAYYSQATGTYSTPSIGYTGNAAGEGNRTFTLTNYIAPDTAEDWATKVDDVEVGNKVYIEKLDVVPEVVGIEGLSVTDVGSGTITIGRLGFDVCEESLLQESLPATEFGDQFIIRIIDREVPN